MIRSIINIVFKLKYLNIIGATTPCRAMSPYWNAIAIPKIIGCPSSPKHRYKAGLNAKDSMKEAMKNPTINRGP